MEETSNDQSINASAFSNNYKYSYRTMSFTIEKKREEFLKQQKEKRKEVFDEKRDLSQLFEVEPVVHDSPIKWHQTKKYPFGYKLMQSHWFIDVPEDLSEKWLIKLCPGGVRYLIVANNAITTCYYRNGRPSMRFKSKLPGGNSDCPHKFTVLDCVFSKELNTIFVYDVLAWNSASLLDAEAEMRFFWLKTKFEENPEMCEIYKNKNLCFVVMDFFPAEKSLIQDNLFNAFVVNDNAISYDGVLFYHREGHYSFNYSPLVGWLRTFMISEILFIDVPPIHLSSKPVDYESVQQYLKSKNKKRQIPEVEMEEVEGVENIEYDNI